MSKHFIQCAFTKQTAVSLLTMALAITSLPACAATGDTESSHAVFEKLEWFETPFGPHASVVNGDFSKGEHVTYIRFLPGMVTPVHTHSSDYTGLVIKGKTMHWQPGKPDTQIELAEGSHWSISANIPHVSECLPGKECIMAIVQKSAFDFIPKTDLPLDDSSIIAIYQQVNSFDIAMGDLATRKAKNEAIKRLGEKVRDDHAGVLEATRTLASKQGIRPVLPVERGFAEQEHQEQLLALSKKSGDDFDRSYLLYELKFHTDAIAAVETALLPNIANTELKKLLTDVLPAFKGHLSHTEKLARDLGYL